MNNDLKEELRLAIDDLEFLIKIAQRHEPGSYRATFTIAKLKELSERLKEEGAK